MKNMMKKLAGTFKVRNVQNLHPKLADIGKEYACQQVIYPLCVLNGLQI